MPTDASTCKSCDGTGSYLDADDQVHACPACRTQQEPSKLAKRIAEELWRAQFTEVPAKSVDAHCSRAEVIIAEHIAPLEAELSASESKCAILMRQSAVDIQVGLRQNERLCRVETALAASQAECEELKRNWKNTCEAGERLGIWWQQEMSAETAAKEQLGSLASMIEQAQNAFGDLEEKRLEYGRLLGAVAAMEWRRTHGQDAEIQDMIRALAEASRVYWSAGETGEVRIRFAVRKSIEQRMELMTADDVRAVAEAAREEDGE